MKFNHCTILYKDQTNKQTKDISCTIYNDMTLKINYINNKGSSDESSNRKKERRKNIKSRFY